MRWATFITKNSETIKHIKEKKELIVEENRRNQLGAKLKEMIKHFDQAEAKRKEPITQSGTGNGIRRREGEKDKRFSVWNKRRVAWRTSFFGRGLYGIRPCVSRIRLVHVIRLVQVLRMSFFCLNRSVKAGRVGVTISNSSRLPDQESVRLWPPNLCCVWV